MSSRREGSWRVLHSYQTFEGDRCVDTFERPDGTFGFEEFRKDPEDMGAWTPVGGFSDLEFASEGGAIGAACHAAPWVAALAIR
jgi:hypothetical protein